jgi:hypothetical protein
MIKTRPTFPTGYPLAGLPAIGAVLHSDERCEVYDLVASECVLIVVRQPSLIGKATTRLTDWWKAQPEQLLEMERVIDAPESPRNSFCAVLRLRGNPLDTEALKTAPQETLKRLFCGMIDAVARGLAVQMYPDFVPSLTWVDANGGTVCTVLPTDGLVASEAEQVQLVAGAFCRFVTGINPELPKTTGSGLLRWSKYAGEELSRLIDRCFAGSSSKACITTWEGLTRGLGLSISEQPKSQGRSPESCPAASPTGKGLDRVAGMHVLKELLRREVVEPVRHPEPYRQYGLSIPNGILLYGPPGCGKTYIARQLANELGHYFVEIIPSELASPYIHQSVMKIRELFDAAAEQAPAVVFIDEFEALVPPRGELGGHQHYKAEEVNEFLAHLNSCADKRIFVIAATNQPDKIDPAVRRTGRLDKLIYVGPPDPDKEARREMLLLHLKSRPAARDLDLDRLASALDHYSASDIRFIVDEAARNALRAAQEITNDSFQDAMRRLRPSVPAEVEAQYRTIDQRGL